MEHHTPALLGEAVIFLAATVLLVPLFSRLKIGSIIGYLAAGVLIGPHVLALISDTQAVLTFGEFGIVMVLFVIGLELRPARLWALRRDIFGLGGAQVLITGPALTLTALALLPVSPQAAIVTGFALALSSTAFALQLYKERGTLNSPAGEKAFAILLLQDMAIVPLLALVAFLSGNSETASTPGWQQGLITVAAVGGVVLAGRYVLPPLFRFIAAGAVREVLTAAALLVVCAVAALMAWLGLSMALGAFIAGVVLAESEFRHQLEADIEPFRGLLLGLFFIGVGMGLNLPALISQPVLVLALTAGLLTLKGAILYGLMRLMGGSDAQAKDVAGTLGQGGEFGFVIIATAIAAGLLTRDLGTLLNAVITLSMLLTPPLAMLALRWAAAGAAQEESSDRLEPVGPGRSHGRKVILAGYGRFGQVVGQMLLARGIDVVFIDSNPVQIRRTQRFGQTVYYGDGKRLDILRAAGAETAELLILCHGERQLGADAVAAIKAEFPGLQVLMRIYDRRHAIEMARAEVNFMVRELFDGSISMGREALRRLGTDQATIDSIETEYRRRDAARLSLQSATGDLMQGRELMFDQTGQDTPAQTTGQTAGQTGAAPGIEIAPQDDAIHLPVEGPLRPPRQTG